MLLLRASLVSGAAGTVTLAWNPNPEPNLAGYNLYYGTTPGSYAHRVPLGSITTHTVSNLAPGMSYYFVVTAINVTGLESDPSNEITVTVPHQRPMGIEVGPFACRRSFAVQTNRYVLAVGDTSTCGTFTATPYETESGPRTVLWFHNGEPFAEGQTITNCFSPGGHIISVVAAEANGASYSATLEFNVIRPAEAIDLITSSVEKAPLERRDKRPLVASLVSAAGYLQSGNFESGVSQLCAFQTKCHAQIGLMHPETADHLISSVGEIVNSLICLAETGNLNGLARVRRQPAAAEEVRRKKLFRQTGTAKMNALVGWGNTVRFQIPLADIADKRAGIEMVNSRMFAPGEVL